MGNSALCLWQGAGFLLGEMGAARRRAGGGSGRPYPHHALPLDNKGRQEKGEGTAGKWLFPALREGVARRSCADRARPLIRFVPAADAAETNHLPPKGKAKRSLLSPPLKLLRSVKGGGLSVAAMFDNSHRRCRIAATAPPSWREARERGQLPQSRYRSTAPSKREPRS